MMSALINDFKLDFETAGQLQVKETNKQRAECTKSGVNRVTSAAPRHSESIGTLLLHRNDRRRNIDNLNRQ